MPPSSGRVLVNELADPRTRGEVAGLVARRLGASALLALVPDAELSVLVPAPGFMKTLPGGAAWAAFLRECAAPGVHHGEVGFPDAASRARAACRTLPDGSAFILVGAAPDIGGLDDPALPLLGALLRAEDALAAADARAAAAQLSARHTNALMAAIDAARADAEKARQSAEQATRAKDEFLAMLGHELRNPLAPIITALQVLKLRGFEASVELGVIERQAEHLVTLVDDLLDISKITRGKVDLGLQETQLFPVVMAAVETASPWLERRNHALSLAVPADGLPLRVDPMRLRQVVANLLTNAARYTDPGGLVELSARRDGDEVVLRVRDNGIGIEPHLLPHIFDLFVQGRRGVERSEGGLGIGLTLVRNIVQMHGGSVSASSPGPGRGAEFEVRLPASAPAPAVTERSPAARSSVTRRGRGRRVLVVDDNVDAAQMLATLLAAVGHEVVAAHDGPQALALADEFDPEVAILDIGLPVMDGYELGQRLRARPRAPRLMALSGYGQEQDRQRSREAGFECHLVKPIQAERVLEAVDQLLPAVDPVAGAGRAAEGEPGVSPGK